MIDSRVQQSYSPFGPARPALDFPLLASVAILCIAGVVFVFTSSAAHAWQATGGQSLTFLSNHVQRLAAGVAAAFLFYHVRYQFLEKRARPVLLIGLLGLIIVLFSPQLPGTTAKRWILLAGISIQPAEIAKYAVLVYAARRLSEIDDSPFPADRKRKFNGLLIVCAIALLLVGLEPNLSMVILTAAMLFCLFFLHGLEWKKIAVMIPVGVLSVTGVVLAKPYMLERIRAFLQGISDPMSASYHVQQSLIAIGQGGWFGLGLGQSTQKHYYLPEPYNDSIFSIVGEESGFVGAALLVIAFSVLIIRGWKIAMNAQDRFAYYLAAGITTSLACSFVINVGVNVALLPATGQPLPFVSYGGSSLVMSLAAVGVLLNIAKQQNRAMKWQVSTRLAPRT
ncbi:MAG: cell division protein FtsW [bacterium]|nr:cell division protein FtsW [bacterium]